MENLVPSLELPITFEERFQVTPVLFFIPDFYLLSCKLDTFTYKVLYWVTFYWKYLKEKINLQYSDDSLQEI